MIYCFYWKKSAWSKGNKNWSSSPHNCCLIIILRCSGRKFLIWLCEETSNNKHGWTPVKYLNVFHDNRRQKCCRTLCKNITNFLFWVLSKYLATSIKNNNPNLKKLWCSSACKTWTPFLTSYFEILPRYCKLINLSTLRMLDHAEQ